MQDNKNELKLSGKADRKIQKYSSKASVSSRAEYTKKAAKYEKLAEKHRGYSTYFKQVVADSVKKASVARKRLSAIDKGTVEAGRDYITTYTSSFSRPFTPGSGYKRDRNFTRNIHWNSSSKKKGR